MVAEQTLGVVVLAGGTSVRLGGGDKTALDVGGLPILVRLLSGLPVVPTVVVAPPPATALPGALAHVRWTREDPPGGGPAAGLAAGFAALPGGLDVVVVLAGDQPFAATAVPRLVAALRASDEAVDAVLGVDGAGRPQPLLAAYRATALGRALPRVRNGDSIRSAIAGIARAFLELAPTEHLDVDNSEDLARAREIAGEWAERPGRDQSG